MTARADRRARPLASAVKLARRRLSIVVLPFANIGGGAEQDYFVDGVTESPDYRPLAHLRRLRHRAQHRLLLQGQARRRPEIGRELGVRYVLEGSVQRSGDGHARQRAAHRSARAALISGPSGSTNRSPISSTMQDEIVSRIANTLKAEIVSAEARRAARTANPDALHLWLRGFDRIQRGGANPEYLASARDCFARALKIDPDNVDAMVGPVSRRIRFSRRPMRPSHRPERIVRPRRRS